MDLDDFNIQFVEDSFSVAKTSCCPKCNSWICFLPDINSLIKKDCKRVIDLLENTGIKVKTVERINVKEWTCHSCKTLYINIQDRNIEFPA
jgi:hypothetical protein